MMQIKYYELRAGKVSNKFGSGFEYLIQFEIKKSNRQAKN